MNRIQQLTSRKPTTAVILTGALWLVMFILGTLAVFALRDLQVWLMAALIPQPTTKSRLETANVINMAQQCGIVIFGMIVLVALIYFTERAIRDAGQPRLMRTLARVIVVEAVIVLPTWWILWR